MASPLSNPFSAMAAIAESRITEAIERGDFDNLPGRGEPLNLEDLSGVPEELRMAYKILKNAGCAPPELLDRKEAVNLLELLDGCPDERERCKQIRRLKALLERMSNGRRRHMALESNDQYYEMILTRLEGWERKAAMKGSKKE